MLATMPSTVVTAEPCCIMTWWYKETNIRKIVCVLKMDDSVSPGWDSQKLPFDRRCVIMSSCDLVKTLRGNKSIKTSSEISFRELKSDVFSEGERWRLQTARQLWSSGQEVWGWTRVCTLRYNDNGYHSNAASVQLIWELQQAASTEVCPEPHTENLLSCCLWTLR